MPCSTVSSLAISTRSSAYFTIWITCPPMLKCPSPSRASLVRHSLYKMNRIGDKQHPCLTPLPICTLLVSPRSSRTDVALLISPVLGNLDCSYLRILLYEYRIYSSSLSSLHNYLACYTSLYFGTNILLSHTLKVSGFKNNFHRIYTVREVCSP